MGFKKSKKLKADKLTSPAVAALEDDGEEYRDYHNRVMLGGVKVFVRKTWDDEVSIALSDESGNFHATVYIKTWKELNEFTNALNNAANATKKVNMWADFGGDDTESCC